MYNHEGAHLYWHLPSQILEQRFLLFPVIYTHAITD